MLLDILRSLGVGGQLITALVVGMVAWYLYRGKGFLGVVVGTVSFGTTIAMAVLVVLAVGIAAGWITPHPGAMMHSLVSAGTQAWGAVGDWLVSHVQHALGG